MPIPKENAKLAPCGAHFREARGQNGGRKEKQDIAMLWMLSEKRWRCSSTGCFTALVKRDLKRVLK